DDADFLHAAGGSQRYARVIDRFRTEIGFRSWIAADVRMVIKVDRRTILSAGNSTAALGPARTAVGKACGGGQNYTTDETTNSPPPHGEPEALCVSSVSAVSLSPPWWRARYERDKQHRSVWNQQEDEGSCASRRRRVTACH